MNKIIIALVIFILIATVIALLVILNSGGRKSKKPDGYIRINKTNPNKDTYTLELNIPFGELDSRDSVIFAVVNVDAIA